MPEVAIDHMQTPLGIPYVTVLMVAVKDLMTRMQILEWSVIRQDGLVLSLFMTEDSVTAIHNLTSHLVLQELVQLLKWLLESAGLVVVAGQFHMAMVDRVQ